MHLFGKVQSCGAVRVERPLATSSGAFHRGDAVHANAAKQRHFADHRPVHMTRKRLHFVIVQVAKQQCAGVGQMNRRKNSNANSCRKNAVKPDKKVGKGRKTTKAKRKSKRNPIGNS